jgi:hypothetical protein
MRFTVGCFDGRRRRPSDAGAQRKRERMMRKVVGCGATRMRSARFRHAATKSAAAPPSQSTICSDSSGSKPIYVKSATISESGVVAGFDPSRSFDSFS